MNSLSKHKVVGKFFTTLTSVATIASLSGVAFLAPVAALAVAPADYGLTEGDVVSAAGSDDPDVYIVNELGYKRLFLNPAIFNFYGHLGGFAAVKNVSAATRDAFGTSGLFRNCETNDPKVYGVEVTAEDTGMLHWVNTTGAQAVMDDANFFKKVFCINNNEFNWYPKGSDYTSVNQVPNYSRGNQAVPAGPLSVSLASSNPVAGTIVDGQARYNLAEFMFSGNATVTSVKLERTGVSADATLTNVYLYDGTKRLTDSATVSSGVITFNDSAGIFTVAGSKVISVLADVDGTSGESVGVRMTSVNGNAVSISGNLHTLATATLATAALSTSVTPSSDGAPVPSDDFVAWQDNVTIGNRYVWLKSVQFRVIGSVAMGDLQNFRLYVDGIMVGSAVAQQDSNGYIVFNMSGSPIKLETGSRTLKVLVNIVNGSGKNFYLSLRQKSDFWTVDSQYGASVLATGTFPVSSTAQNIASGTLTITKTNDSPSGDVVKGASGVVLARFEFKAAGERMKVENLRVSNTSTGDRLALRNGTLFANGVQVGSTATIWEDNSPAASNSTAYTEFNLGSSLIVEPGSPKTVEIRSDIYDASGTDGTVAGQTITANFEVGSSNVQRLTTLDYVNGPTSAQGIKSGNQMTVSTGSMTSGKYTGYANQSVVDPKSNVKIGHFTLTAASSETVNVNTIDIGPDPITGTTFDGDDLSDTYIKVWNDSGALVYTSPVKSTALSLSSSTSFSVNFTLPANKTYQVEVWSNVGSGITTTHSVRLDFSATGVTVGSSTTSTTSVVTGQLITSQAGNFTYANGSLSVSAIKQGGTTTSAYQFSITPSYDDFYLEEVYIDVTSGTLLASTSGAIGNLTLKSGGSTLGTATLNSTTGSASFTGLNFSLPQSGGQKTFDVDVTFATVGVGGNDTYGSVSIRLDGLKYHDSQGSVTTTNGLAPGSYSGNDFMVVKAYPVFTNVALDSQPLATGENTLFKTSVSGVGGNVGLYRLVFHVTRTNGPTFNANENTWKLLADGVDITSLGVFASASSVDLTAAAANTGYVSFTFTNEYVISSAKTLEMKGTIVAVGSNYQGVTTKLANTSTVSSAPDGASTVAGTVSSTSATVVWTDGSVVGHSLTTDDWMNDFLVQTINASQTRAISQ